MIDFKDRTILITGGTQGIGLAIALAFAKYGGKCLLTYHFGSQDEEELIKKFSEHNYPLPKLFQANVSDPVDTENLFNSLQEQEEKIDVYICNVAVAAKIGSFEDYSLSALKKTLSSSSWPLFSYTYEIQKRFGKYPRYVIGLSSTGPDYYSHGYDYVATAKKVMEVMCRYMSHHLRHEQVSLNIVRSRGVKTESFEKVFGKEFVEFSQNFVPDKYWMEPGEIANAAVALASGYLDMMRGQVINVDRGIHFFDNFMDLYTRRNELPVKQLLSNLSTEVN